MLLSAYTVNIIYIYLCIWYNLGITLRGYPEEAMLRKLVPDMVLDSISNVDFTDMSSRLKIKGFIVDIDNTLVPARSNQPDTRAVEWVKSAIEKGFKICFVSNALRKRVTNFGNFFGVDYIYRALKPRRHSFRKAAVIMGLDRTETAVIGDQIFTDIYGGNRAGMFTILVTPIASSEIFLIKPRRLIERFVLKHYFKAYSSDGRNRPQYRTGSQKT